MMSKVRKLNTVLATTDHGASTFKKMVEDFLGFFNKNQGAFRGALATYTPRDGEIDEPNRRGNKRVVTTVDEKLQWFEEKAEKYIDNLFALEATNASGAAKAELIVEDKSWGTYSSLELLRLKSFLENQKLRAMYEAIPVRPETENWKQTDNEMYEGRKIFEADKNEGINKTTIKESYILPDPNIEKASSYTPMTAERNIVKELGAYTQQVFSGEASHRERADILHRRSQLLEAVIDALKRANEAEIVHSELTAKHILGYLHRGRS